MTDFLSEIESVYHQELLEKGNLREKHQHPYTPRWTSAPGVFARFTSHQCRCGRVHNQFLGFFGKETSGENSRYVRSLWFPPPQNPRQTEIETLPPSEACAGCIADLGFPSPLQP